MIFRIIFRSVVVAGLVSLAMIPSCKAYSPFITQILDKDEARLPFPQVNLTPEVFGVLLPTMKPWIAEDVPEAPVQYEKNFVPKSFHYNTNGILNFEFAYEPDSRLQYENAKFVFYEKDKMIEIGNPSQFRINNSDGERLLLCCRCGQIAYYDKIEVWIPGHRPVFAYKRQIAWMTPKEKYFNDYQLYLIAFLTILLGHVVIVERRVILNYIQWKQESSTGESWYMTYTVVGVLLLALVFFVIVIAVLVYGFSGDAFTARIWRSDFRLAYCIESIYAAGSWLIVGVGFFFIETLMVNDVRFYWLYVVDKWAQFTPHSRDDYGVLWNSINNVENFQVVDVINSTPSHPERYLIPVPSQFSTAKAAIAWTFGLKENEYNPVKQT